MLPGVGFITATVLPSREIVHAAPAGSVVTVIVWLDPLVRVAHPVNKTGTTTPSTSRRTSAASTVDGRDMAIPPIGEATSGDGPMTFPERYVAALDGVDAVRCVPSSR